MSVWANIVGLGEYRWLRPHTMKYKLKCVDKIKLDGTYPTDVTQSKFTLYKYQKE
jgi:hypothetical protein